MDKGGTTLDRLALQYEAFNRSEAKTEKTIHYYNALLRISRER